MDAPVEKLDARLREWKPETAAEVRERVTEVLNRVMRMRSICCARVESNRRSPAGSMSPQPGEVWLTGLGLTGLTGLALRRRRGPW